MATEVIKLTTPQRRVLGQTKPGLLIANIISWTDFVDRWGKKENLTDDQKDNLLYRRMMIKEWRGQLGDSPDAVIAKALEAVDKALKK